MAEELATVNPLMDAIEKVLVTGDLSRLTQEQRVAYYDQTCNSLGLNRLTRPFDYITLNGKLQLYARKDATDQLRKIHGVSIRKLEKEVTEGVYCVTAYAEDKTARTDSSLGAVSINGLKGDALANAMMKAETKSKRRVTLSICGLGMLDETELETIPAARYPAISDTPIVPTNEQIHDMEPRETMPPDEVKVISKKAGKAWATSLLGRIEENEKRIAALGKCTDGELLGMLADRWSKSDLPDEPQNWTNAQQKIGLGIVKATIEEFESREGQAELANAFG